LVRGEEGRAILLSGMFVVVLESGSKPSPHFVAGGSADQENSADREDLTEEPVVHHTCLGHRSPWTAVRHCQAVVVRGVVDNGDGGSPVALQVLVTLYEDHSLHHPKISTDQVIVEDPELLLQRGEWLCLVAPDVDEKRAKAQEEKANR